MRRSGFSLIELLIIVAMIAALTGGAMMRVDVVAEDARVAALRHNLKTLRQALDDHHADRRRWPASLDELVKRRYLRELPSDPVAGRTDAWVTVPSAPGAGDVADVKSSVEAYRCY